MSQSLEEKTDPSGKTGLQQHAVIIRSPEQCQESSDFIADEVPVAMVYNGISHAVMMATPLDLEDFALGFSLTEGILTRHSQCKGIDIIQSELGYELQMEVSNEAFAKLKDRRRQLSGRTGCGLCGLESLQSVKPHIMPVAAEPLPDYSVVSEAVENLKKGQRLQGQCGATHAAGFVEADGRVIHVREDVGRHNALDKLLGAIVQESKQGRFVVVSSRASYEMVYKTASQNIGTLVSVSAPTSMAIALAQQGGMNLVGFIRPKRQIIYCQS